MHTTLRNSFRVCAVALCLFVLSALSASAAYEIELIPNPEQVVGDFVVGPGKVEVTVEPGKERTVEMVVTNRMGEPRIFSFNVEDTRGSSNPEEAVVLLGSERGPYSLKDYIKIPEMSFELKQGERARIPVTVSIPEDAEPGGLYGSVLVTTTSRPGVDEEIKEAGARAGSVIISRIGTLFFVTVPGEVEKEGHLVDFSTVPDKEYFSSGPITFQVLFENTGSIHLSPYGVIRIKNVFGQEVAEIQADPWFALPASLRYRELVWDREHLFGYYTAELQVNRGYDNVIDTMSVSFFVIPWGIILGTFGGLLVLVFLVRLFNRTFELKRRDS